MMLTDEQAVVETVPEPAPVWPRKVELLGVQVTPTDYDQATRTIIAAARQRQSCVVSCHAVHAIVTTSGDPELRRRVNTFDMVTPDGQPVRWALNLLHAAGLRDRVYGPQLMLHLCQAAAQAGVGIYLYGGTPEVLRRLEHNLQTEFPQLNIAGSEAPPFRRLTEQEDREAVERINGSGAGLVFIGLGCPKQDDFAFEHRDRIQGVQICVGAAFDFHAGVKPMAPAWMQRRGLEWLFRLSQEPRRLWQRYLVTNTIYLMKLVRSLLNVPRVLRQRAVSRRGAVVSGQ